MGLCTITLCTSAPMLHDAVIPSALTPASHNTVLHLDPYAKHGTRVSHVFLLPRFDNSLSSSPNNIPKHAAPLPFHEHHVFGFCSHSSVDGLQVFHPVTPQGGSPATLTVWSGHSRVTPKGWGVRVMPPHRAAMATATCSEMKKRAL